MSSRSRERSELHSGCTHFMAELSSEHCSLKSEPHEAIRVPTPMASVTTLTISNDSRSNNCLNVSQPVSVSWQEISVFVKSSSPMPPPPYQVYKSYTPPTKQASKRKPRSSFDGIGDVENDVAPAELEETRQEDLEKNRTLEEEREEREKKGRHNSPSPSLKTNPGLTDDLRPDMSAAKKARVTDRNASATNRTDPGVFGNVGKEETQSKKKRNECDDFLHQDDSGNSTDDFQIQALALEEELPLSPYSLQGKGAKDRNENHPGKLDKEKTVDPKQPVSKNNVAVLGPKPATDDATPKVLATTGDTKANADKAGAKTGKTVPKKDRNLTTAAQGKETKNQALENKTPYQNDTHFSIGTHPTNNEVESEGATTYAVSDGAMYKSESKAFEGEDDVALGTENETKPYKPQFFEPVAYDFPEDTGNVQKGAPSVGDSKQDHSRLSEYCEKREPGRSNRWKPILRDVTGIAEPGSILAVMGASGSGKTTLMTVLAGRHVGDCHVSGTVRFNGVKVSQSRLRQLCAYVPQHRLFLPNLTVRETLTFRATLELEGSSKGERSRVVTDILRDMSLMKAADTLVGSPESKKGISGGELKRLSFACELLSNPPLLLCDEPTSGLDTAMAEHTVHVLRTLAERQHTVICTIHQPSSRTFGQFDKVLLLTEGRTAFLGSCPTAVEFFSSLGYLCPINYNPADFFIETLSCPPGVEPGPAHRKARKISRRFQRTIYGLEVLGHVRLLTYNSLLHASEIRKLLRSHVRRRASWRVQLRANLWRFWTCLRRDRGRVWSKVLSGIVVALVLALFFYRLDLDSEGRPGYTQSSVLSVNGALFVLTAITAYANAHRVIIFFPEWIPILLVDSHNALYRPDAFFLAACLVNLPVQLLTPLLTILVDYWAIGLVRQAASFFTAVGIVALSGTTGAAFGLAMSAIFANTDTALTVAGAFMMPLLISSGYLLNAESTPGWAGWLRYVSWIRHTNELLMLNQWVPVERIVCGSVNGSGCLFRDGADVLSKFQLKEGDGVECYVNMVVLLMVFYLLAFLALFLRTRRSRT